MQRQRRHGAEVGMRCRKECHEVEMSNLFLGGDVEHPGDLVLRQQRSGVSGS